MSVSAHKIEVLRLAIIRCDRHQAHELVDIITDHDFNGRCATVRLTSLYKAKDGAISIELTDKRGDDDTRVEVICGWASIGETGQSESWPVGGAIPSVVTDAIDGLFERLTPELKE